MKIREIYTVIREQPIKNLQEVLDRIPYIQDEGIGNFLYNEIHDDERVELKFQINNGDGWEDFDPKN